MMPSSPVNIFKLCSAACRHYAQCCPPRTPHGSCPCPPPPSVPGAGKRILPQSECRPGPIPPNPCVPRFPHGKDAWKKYRSILFFICFPLIIVQAINALSHHPPHKNPEDCRDYEYMRKFVKRFPWREGDKKTLFHNDHVNFAFGECEPPELDCD